MCVSVCVCLCGCVGVCACVCVAVCVCARVCVVKHNIYILLHACSATVRLRHSWADGDQGSVCEKFCLCGQLPPKINVSSYIYIYTYIYKIYMYAYLHVYIAL